MINSHNTHSPGEVVYHSVGYLYTYDPYEGSIYMGWMYFRGGGRAAYFIRHIHLSARLLKTFNVSFAF